MDGVAQFRNFKPAAADATHPDHGLARLLAGIDMVRLPLLSDDAILDRLISGADRIDLDRPLQPADSAAAQHILFGTTAGARNLVLPPNATLRDLYRTAVQSAAFRAACGRISASSAW
jgi:hypothetical protein